MIIFLKDLSAVYYSTVIYSKSASIHYTKKGSSYMLFVRVEQNQVPVKIRWAGIRKSIYIYIYFSLSRSRKIRALINVSDKKNDIFSIRYLFVDFTRYQVEIQSKIDSHANTYRRYALCVEPTSPSSLQSQVNLP